MASREANMAVDQYRKMLKMQFKADRELEKTHHMVVKLSHDDMAFYVAATSEIEEAAELATEQAMYGRWAFSTFSQEWNRRVNQAGRDESDARV